MPTVELPAESAIVLDRTDWLRFIDIIEDDAPPNEALRRAAERTARDRITQRIA